jgi:hypothetical protein
LVSSQTARPITSNSITVAQSLRPNVSATNKNDDVKPKNEKCPNDTDKVVIDVAKTSEEFISKGKF